VCSSDLTTPWLPRQIMDKELDAQRLRKVLERGLHMVARVETVIRKRVGSLTRGMIANRINGLAIVAGAGLLMLPLGLVPFSNTLPALAILLLCIGMSQRDGLLVIAGYGALVATVSNFTLLGWAVWRAEVGLATFFAAGSTEIATFNERAPGSLLCLFWFEQARFDV